MKEDPAPTLSPHLLAEASKFFLHPNRRHRTKANLKLQQLFDDGLQRLVEWRKTFAPKPNEVVEEFLNQIHVLDEFYSREFRLERPCHKNRWRLLIAEQSRETRRLSTDWGLRLRQELVFHPT
jgi:hypothetical protein